MPSFHVMRTIVIVFFFALAFSPFSPFMGSSPCFISLCWKSWQEKNVNFKRVNARWFWQKWTMFTFVVPLFFLLSQGLIVVIIESSSSSSCQHWHCANHHDLLLPAFPLQDSALHRICGGIPNHSYWQDPEVCHEVIFQSSIACAKNKKVWILLHPVGGTWRLVWSPQKMIFKFIDPLTIHAEPFLV